MKPALLSRFAACFDDTYVAAHTPRGEVSGAGYSRKQVDWKVYTDDGLLISSATTVSWPPAGSDWGDITSFCLCDEPKGGNELLDMPLARKKTIEQGDVLSIPAGELQFAIGHPQ